LAVYSVYGLSIFVVGIVGDGTGVDDADVGFFALFGAGMTTLE
jgi:hypothetical protein